MEGLVSIIVPVYNSSKYLEKCVDSLVNQTYKNIEIILINDGSTDKSGELCSELEKKYPHLIKTIHKQNSGVCSSRNIGLKNAKGQFISFVDSDDWIELNMMEVLVNNIKTTNSDLAVCGMQDEYEGIESKKSENTFVVNTVNKCETFDLVIRNKSFYGYVWNKIFKRTKLCGQLFDESLSLCEDLDFCIEYLRKCKTICYTLDELYHYRRYSTSFTGDLEFCEKKLTALKVYERLINIYCEERKDLLYIVECNYLKMAINLKGRLILSNKNDNRNKIYLNSIIKRYYKKMLSNRKISLFQKLNIFFSKSFPKTSIKVKQAILKVKDKN